MSSKDRKKIQAARTEEVEGRSWIDWQIVEVLGGHSNEDLVLSVNWRILKSFE